jgi:regulator of sigma E protease
MLQTIWSIIVALLVLSVIVLVHELGHFLTARRLGFKVREFGIGMGPKLKKWVRDDVTYSLRVFPIGGFVNFYGEDEDIDDPRAFNRQKPWKRLLSIAAGPIANIFFAFLITIGLLMAVGETVPVVNNVMDGYPAQAAGLQAGDRIVAVDGAHVNFSTEAQLRILQNTDETVLLTIQRGDTTADYEVGYKQDAETGISLVGINFDPTPQTFGFFEAIGLSFSWIVFVTQQMFSLLGGLLTGTQSTAAVVGPVGTISLIGQSAQIGLYSLLRLGVLISINLGIFNLLPLPALDGSRIVFILVEMVRGKPIPPEREGMVHFIGLILLIGLMVLVTYQDIARLISGNGVLG